MVIETPATILRNLPLSVLIMKLSNLEIAKSLVSTTSQGFCLSSEERVAIEGYLSSLADVSLNSCRLILHCDITVNNSGRAFIWNRVLAVMSIAEDFLVLA